MEVAVLVSIMASREAERFFKKRLMRDTNYLPKTNGASFLALQMTCSIFSWYSYPKVDLEAFPADYFQLAAVLKDIFSVRFCKMFETRCLEFDALVKQQPKRASLFRGSRGSQLAVSSAMISEHTFQHWICQLCTGVAIHCFRQAAAQFGGVMDPRTMRHRDIEYLYEDRTVIYERNITAQGSPFTQITLRGPDLITAWTRCGTTNDLENMAPKDAAWNPSQPSSFPVYYGTAAHLNKFDGSAVESVVVPSRGLPDREYIPGIAPRGASFRLARTTFGPLRSFLPAVFAAEVLGKMPSWNGEQFWKSGDQEYEGVMLFQFDVQQPHLPGDSSYVIPKGKEAAWRDAASASVRYSTHPAECWGLFAGIHGQRRGSEWPTVLHEMEPAEIQRILGALTGSQLWRTVWCDTGVSYIRKAHKESFAIKYHIEPDREGGALTRLFKNFLGKR